PCDSLAGNPYGIEDGRLRLDLVSLARAKLCQVLDPDLVERRRDSSQLTVLDQHRFAQYLGIRVHFDAREAVRPQANQKRLSYGYYVQHAAGTAWRHLQSV